MGVSVAASAVSGGRRGYPRAHRLGRPPAVGQQEKTAMEDSDSSSEELRYGPGIVSRLKDRYISMALREATRRPSLRRVSSLEHIANATVTEEAKPTVTTSTGVTSGGTGKTPVSARGRPESMKRAKSVGDLTYARPSGVVGGGAAPAAGTRASVQRRDRKGAQPPPADALPEKIVIVEERGHRPAVHPVVVAPQARPPPPMAESPPPGEDALPPPDTVKTVKRIFEPSPRRPGVAARPATAGSRAVIDRGGRGRRASPTSRPPLTARPAVKPASPALKSSSREKLASGAARGPPLKAVPVPAAAAEVTTPSSPLSPTVSQIQSSDNRRTTSEDVPDLAPRRPEKLTWASLRQSSISEGTQTPSPPGSPSVAPATPPIGPPRPAKAPLSRESSAEPVSPSSSPVRRQVGIIKPNRKLEHRTDEFSRRKNQLNHVRNSVVEKEIAVIGTEYLKRRDVEEPAPVVTRPAAALNGAREATPPTADSAPPPALPPRKAVLEPKKTLPLTIDTAPPRPAPFQGVILKPVPKAEPPPVEESSPSPPLKPKARQPEPEPVREPVRESPREPVREPVREPIREPVREPVKQPEPKTFSPPAVRPPLTTPVPAAAAVTRPAPPSVTRPQPAAPAPEVVNRGPPPAKPKWHQAADNTMTFNFTKRQEVPDYVEDDGLIMRRKLPKSIDSGYVILPGFDPGQTDDDDLGTLVGGPPSPCNVVFSNADIIIDGKSSLMKKPKTRKMAVSFSVSRPSTHEYPSETSLLAAEASSAGGDPSATTGALGGLASYTPHKLQTGADFELGVSRLTPAAPRPEHTAGADETDDFLKPADESETVTWSSETSADILF